jgi:hypothetical protein
MLAALTSLLLRQAAVTAVFEQIAGDFVFLIENTITQKKNPGKFDFFCLLRL